MFDRLNELASRLVRVARETRHPALAAEVFSYLPASDAASARMLSAQLRVVQSLLRLRPSRSGRLNAAVEATVRELALVERALKETR